MPEKVKLSKDGNSIDFFQAENVPTSIKKLRQSPEIEGFYRFIYENDLQKETYEILDRIIVARKAKKATLKKEQKALAKEAANAARIEAEELAEKLKPTPKAAKVVAVAPKKQTALAAKLAKPETKKAMDKAKPAPKAKAKPALKAAAKPAAKAKPAPKAKAKVPAKSKKALPKKKK